MRLPKFLRRTDDGPGLLARLGSKLVALLHARSTGKSDERIPGLPPGRLHSVDALDGVMAKLLAGTTESPRSPGSRDLDHTLPAGEQPHSRARRYRVHVPDGIDPEQPVPLVVALHGCLQTHLDMQHVSGLDRIADRERFIVAYPYVSGVSGLGNLGCWSWWSSDHRRRDHGQVGDIWRIVEKIARDQPVDLARVHVCGLSSGAGMTVAALVAYSDRIASGASVAGLAYGENTRAVQISRYLTPRYAPLAGLVSAMRRHLVTRSPPPLLIVQSTDDSTVAPICARHLRQCWEHITQAVRVADRATQGSTHGVPWQLDSYYDGDKRLSIMQLTVEGVPHGWLGGAAGKYSTPLAPDIAELMWWFFVRSTLTAGNAVPEPREHVDSLLVSLDRAS